MLFVRCIEHKPPSPDLTVSALKPSSFRLLRRQISNKNEHRVPISRQQRLLEKRARFLIPYPPLDGNLSSSAPFPVCQPPYQKLSFQIRIGSLSTRLGHILIEIVELVRHSHLNSKDINNCNRIKRFFCRLKNENIKVD